jgi:hypothetical protein
MHGRSIQHGSCHVTPKAACCSLANPEAKSRLYTLQLADVCQIKRHT